MGKIDTNSGDIRLSPKEQAKELIEKYKPIVYPYCGSGFMTNTVDPAVVLLNAKEGAHIALELLIRNQLIPYEREYWMEVRAEVQRFTE